MPHLLARRYCMRGFSDCHGEGWVHIDSHRKTSGQLLWHICAAGFTVGSSKPANYAMPGQSQGTRAPPPPVLHCSDLSWHGFDPLQRALGSGTACTDINASQIPSPICSRSVSRVKEFSSVDVASACQVASWPEWILAVLNLLIKMYVYATDQDSGLGGVHQLWSGIFLFPARFSGQGIFQFTLFFLLRLFCKQHHFYRADINPSIHPCQMVGMLSVIVLYICRQLIWRQEWFRPDQINNGNTGITRSLPMPLSCFATRTSHFSSAADPTWTAEEEPMLYNYQWKVQASHRFQV